MDRRVLRWLCIEDHVDLAERRTVEMGPRHPRAIFIGRAVGIGKIDRSVFREVGIEQNVEEPPLALEINFRHTGHRVG